MAFSQHGRAVIWTGQGGEKRVMSVTGAGGYQ